MDAQVEDIQQRIATSAASTERLLFWEDETGEYRELIAQLQVPGIEVVYATHAELATKRLVLRQNPDSRYVIYRAGETPLPTDDLIYDLKCASVPFTVAAEGLWAQECGIEPRFAHVLAKYPAFFRSKERREGLAKSTLPKSSPDEIALAMCAATLLVRDGSGLDAARDMAKRLIVEWERGNEESLRLLDETGLTETLWNTLRTMLGYVVPAGAAPSVDDLALRLLQALLGDLVTDSNMMSTPEATRIVTELALSPKTRPAYEKMVGVFGKEVFSEANLDSSTDIQTLARIDGLPQVDEAILMRFVQTAPSVGQDLTLLESVYAQRRHGLWAQKYTPHYQTLLALGRFREAQVKYDQQVPGATTFDALLEGYTSSWFAIDMQYRELIAAWHGISGTSKFKVALGSVVEKAESKYTQYLSDMSDRWQSHAMDAGVWPPKLDTSQASFFKQCVERELPESAHGRRIGVIVSDALRYEMGVSLASQLVASKLRSIAGRTSVSIKPAISMLPSYTQLGMAALLPDGPLAIEADTSVTKSGKPTQGTAARQKLLGERILGAVAVQAQTILDSGMPDISNSQLVFVYHNVIDKVGDKRDTESTVFRETPRALAEIEQLTAMLLTAGCKKVFITADHGFIYQDHEPEAYEYVDVKELAFLKGSDLVDSAHTRRFAVGAIPASDALIEFTPQQLSLEGNLKVAVPKGIARLRLSGSGARFVHGGLSPQETVIPIVCVEITASKGAAHPTDVEGYPLGRATITGSTVMLDVYQVEPVSDKVGGAVAIVGLYAGDGTLLSSVEQTLTLNSESSSSEDRKTRVVLRLTDDVDSHNTAFLRIYTRVGQTNARKLAWEREYTINRAFGMDF